MNNNNNNNLLLLCYFLTFHSICIFKFEQQNELTEHGTKHINYTEGENIYILSSSFKAQTRKCRYRYFVAIFMYVSRNDHCPSDSGTQKRN